MERTWMPTVAGILNIITGAFGLTGGLALIALGTLASGALEPFVFGMLPLIPLALFSIRATSASSGDIDFGRTYLRTAKENVGTGTRWFHRSSSFFTSSGDTSNYICSPVKKGVCLD